MEEQLPGVVAKSIYLHKTTSHPSNGKRSINAQTQQQIITTKKHQSRVMSSRRKPINSQAESKRTKRQTLTRAVRTGPAGADECASETVRLHYPGNGGWVWLASMALLPGQASTRETNPLAQSSRSRRRSGSNVYH